jgi:RNA polymerase sigma-70 factor (ECF subfamily)
MTGYSVAQLVARTRAGDRSAAEALARRFMPACRAIALAILGNPQEADDACQDAFIAAIRDIDSCKQPDRFGAWIGQIVRNRARDVIRQRSVRIMVSLQHTDLVHEQTQSGTAERSELRDRLLAALALLPEEQREAVLLHDVEGWKHREIAAILGIPHGTVRSHVHHARAKMRVFLQHYRDDIS